MCETENPTFVYMHRESGLQGEAAREMLMQFIKEKQESPIPGLRSVVVKVTDQGRKPRPTKEKRAPSPVLLEEPDDISLEEPPIKVRRTTSVSGSSFLQELECSPFTCDTSSSVSEIEEIQFVDIYDGTIENDNRNSEIKKDTLKGKKKETDKEKETNKRKEIESEKDKRREINTEKENDNDKETEKSKDNDKKKETGKEKGTDKR